MDRTQLKVRAFERRWARVGEDLCTIVRNTPTDGGGSGDTLTLSTIESDVPCIYEPVGQKAQFVVGGETYLASHRLTLESTANSLLIKPEDRIKVQARGSKSELIFQQPVIINSEGFQPLTVIAATLVQQGY